MGLHRQMVTMVEERFIQLPIMKQMELYMANKVGGINMKYEQPNMVILRLEKTDIVITSLTEDNGAEIPEYPSKW